MAAWLLDLIAAKLRHDKLTDPEAFTGIVIVDEIEQHLHPRWQRTIIQKLHQHFPKIQWILTTHSPLCAAGLADLPEAETQLIKLERDEQVSIVTQVKPAARSEIPSDLDLRGV